MAAVVAALTPLAVSMIVSVHTAAVQRLQPSLDLAGTVNGFDDGLGIDAARLPV